MGVVRYRKVLPEQCARRTSESNSNSESLPSDSEYEDNNHRAYATTSTSPPKLRKTAPFYDDATPKGKTGKRKFRRYMNKQLLENLHGVELDEDSPHHPHLMETYKSPFERLVEASPQHALELLEYFHAHVLPVQEDGDAQQDRDRDTRPYMRISQKIRRALRKARKTAVRVATVRQVETELVEHFQAVVTTDCAKKVLRTPGTSFERLLIHGVAQYHNLHSISLLECDLFKVEVSCHNPAWTPEIHLLCDFILDQNTEQFLKTTD